LEKATNFDLDRGIKLRRIRHNRVRDIEIRLYISNILDWNNDFMQILVSAHFVSVILDESKEHM